MEKKPSMAQLVFASGGIGWFKGKGRPRIISIKRFLEYRVISVQQRFGVLSCLVLLYRDPEIENILKKGI